MATFTFDPAHSEVGFSVRHMMVSTVRGRFEKVEGVLELDEANLANSSVQATIDAKSLNSGVADRDGHLLGPDFFDTDKYPTLTFKSTSIELTGENEGKVHGELTIRDVTRPVTLDVEYFGKNTNPWGQVVAGFAATTKINREDFGLEWNVALETGGVLVGKEVKIELNIEATPQA